MSTSSTNSSSSSENNNNNPIMPICCSALCGKKAVGSLEVTNKISLPLCDQCQKLINADQKHRFTLFDSSSTSSRSRSSRRRTELSR
jgi:hypothetical protein